MRKVLFFLFVSVITATTISAQQIAVVSANGTTTTYESFDEALTDAEDGSVVYLPGGGFSVKDETKITKKLTILGVSHRADTDNADGATMINGNLNFEGGSDGSALMGVYLSGNVNIGTSETSVQNILVKYCNINSVYVNNSLCLGIVINQNYIRKMSVFGSTNAIITHNILHSIANVKLGIIANNIVCSTGYYSYQSNNFARVYDTVIENNVIISPGKINTANDILYGSNCQISGNMVPNRIWGEDGVQINEDWDNVFVNNSGITTISNYHLKTPTSNMKGIIFMAVLVLTMRHWHQFHVS